MNRREKCFALCLIILLSISILVEKAKDHIYILFILLSCQIFPLCTAS